MSLFANNLWAPRGQARAVRAYLEDMNSIANDARVDIAEWHNGREKGFVLAMRAPQFTGPQLNIAFFEHRNTDDICAVVWEQSTTNPPTIHDAALPEAYRNNKYAVTYIIGAGEAGEMADWIYERLQEHWRMNVDAT